MRALRFNGHRILNILLTITYRLIRLISITAQASSLSITMLLNVSHRILLRRLFYVNDRLTTRRSRNARIVKVTLNGRAVISSTRLNEAATRVSMNGTTLIKIYFLCRIIMRRLYLLLALSGLRLSTNLLLCLLRRLLTILNVTRN